MLMGFSLFRCRFRIDARAGSGLRWRIIWRIYSRFVRFAINDPRPPRAVPDRTFCSRARRNTGIRSLLHYI